jgi:hypothetical protein
MNADSRRFRSAGLAFISVRQRFQGRTFNNEVQHLTRKGGSMSQKVAVAIVHGVGRQGPGFAGPMIAALRRRFARAVPGAPPDALAFRPVYWAPVLQAEEDALWGRLQKGGRLCYANLRQFMVDFAADAIAYQPLPGETSAYNAVHAVMAKALGGLAAEAGGTAPLCVIAHSLGTVIASNYLYDLQKFRERPLIPNAAIDAMGTSPLEWGETLAGLHTMGSPLALWSLPYADFGVPVDVPSPHLASLHPRVRGAWINYYDCDDVIGSPLKTLNAAYGRAVTEDREVRVGSLLTGWNPLCHEAYWTAGEVVGPVAESLAAVWRAVN